ncbi:hypothetical protein D9M70_566020 [compost metagenome]
MIARKSLENRDRVLVAGDAGDLGLGRALAEQRAQALDIAGSRRFDDQFTHPGNRRRNLGNVCQNLDRPGRLRLFGRGGLVLGGRR